MTAADCYFFVTALSTHFVLSGAEEKETPDATQEHEGFLTQFAVQQNRSM